MRAVVQRVARSSVTVNEEAVASIGCGIVVLVGFHQDDSPADMEYIANKIFQLRIFDDEDGGQQTASMAGATAPGR